MGHGKNQFIITNAKFQSTSSKTPSTDAKIFSTIPMVAEEMIIIVVWRECASKWAPARQSVIRNLSMIVDNTLQYHVIPCLTIQYQAISIARRSFIRNLDPCACHWNKVQCTAILHNAVSFIYCTAVGLYPGFNGLGGRDSTFRCLEFSLFV